MFRRCLPILLLCPVFLMQSTLAQQLRSPEVHEDGRVTFRLAAPKAEAVSVAIAGSKPEMHRGENGVWSVTTEPLPAGIHDYMFDVDGLRVLDPSNRRVKKWLSCVSMVEIPGKEPLLTELQPVPHGSVITTYYTSPAVDNQQRPVVIYTPPGYSESDNKAYPLLLLFHGFGDDETAWTEVGRAHLIIDNLIAAGRIRPLIVAMPYGHPLPVPIGNRPDNYFESNAERHTEDVMTALMPFLESHFRLSSERSDRFVAGLSMGGGHAIDLGLKHTDKVSAIGAFSAATPQQSGAELTGRYPALGGDSPAADTLSRFWIPIGRSDFLLDRNNSFTRELKSLGIRHEYTLTEGGHSWDVWRVYLPEFLESVAGAE